MTLSSTFETLRQNEIRLKWMIVQLMQRHKLDQVVLSTKNNVPFDLAISQDLQHETITLKVRRASKDEPTATDPSGVIGSN